MALGEAETVVRSMLGEMTMGGDRRLKREREAEIGREERGERRAK